MLVRDTGTLGRCGGGASQRPFFLPLHCQSNGIHHQIYRLLCPGLVGHDTVVVEIPAHSTLAFSCADS